MCPTEVSVSVPMMKLIGFGIALKWKAKMSCKCRVNWLHSMFSDVNGALNVNWWTWKL